MRSISTMVVAGALCFSHAALAQSKEIIAQAQSGFSSCLSNLNSTSKATAAIRSKGFAPVGTASGISSFLAADSNSVVAVSVQSSADRICSLVIKGARLKTVEKLAAAYAKQLGASPAEVGDARASKRWLGQQRNSNIAVVVLKKASGVNFKAPGITVVSWK